MARQYRREVYRSSRIVVEFEMDRRGIAEVAVGKELRLAVRTIALKGKAYAESIAPQESGEYRASFQIAMSRITVEGMRRISSKVVNTHPAAKHIEIGTKPNDDGSGGGTPAHHTLRKTLAYLTGGGPQQTLNDPEGRPGTLQPIPTVEQFREQQRQRREEERRRRRRRRRAREFRPGRPE